MSDALVRIPVGVVVERRKAQSAWIDFTWKPQSVMVGEPEAAPWTLLSEQEDGATYYAGTVELEFYRTETGNYRSNLASGAPSLWVALRPCEGEPPYQLFAVTADPAEGEAWTEAGSDLVDVVPMPEPVRAMLEPFVAEHHIERVFHKRKRERFDPGAFGRRAPIREDGSG